MIITIIIITQWCFSTIHMAQDSNVKIQNLWTMRSFSSHDKPLPLPVYKLIINKHR